MSVRPWSAKSPLRTQRPSTAIARATPLPPPTFFVAREDELVLQRRLEIRLWSAADLRERLLQRSFFRDTVINTLRLEAGQSAPRVEVCCIAEALYAHRVDGASFLELTQEDLSRHVGVRQLGMIKAIMREVAHFCEEPVVGGARQTTTDSDVINTADGAFEDPYSAAWASMSQQKPQRHTHLATSTVQRPQSAMHFSTLNPFADDTHRSPSSASLRVSSDDRLSKLLAESRERRVRARAAARQKHELAVGLTSAIHMFTRQHEAVLEPGGVAAAVPWQHEQLLSFGGPLLNTDTIPTRSSDTAPAVTISTTAAIDDVARCQPPLLVPSPRQSGGDTTTAEPSAPPDGRKSAEPSADFFVPGPLEQERRREAFAASYVEVTESVDRVTLGFVLRGVSDAHRWDHFTYVRRCIQLYAEVRRVRAARRRHRRLQALGAGVTSCDDPVEVSTSFENAPLEKCEELVLDLDEYRLVLTDICGGMPPSAVDHLLRAFSEKFGEAHRESTRRMRDVDAALQLWDPAHTGPMTAVDIEQIVAALNSALAPSSAALRLRLFWTEESTPYFVREELVGSSCIEQQQQLSVRDSVTPLPPNDVIRPADLQTAFVSFCDGLPAELFDEVTLALRVAIEQLTHERRGLSAYAVSEAEINTALDGLSVDQPILVCYSSIVSPTVTIERIVRAASTPLIRVSVASSNTEDLALERIKSAIADGSWVYLTFPRRAAVSEPPPIPMPLAPFVEEEPIDMSSHHQAMGSRAGSASSLSSVSAASLTSGAVVDSYSGERFTGAMVTFLRRVALLCLTTLHFHRHHRFRLVCHLPVDFASPLQLPTALRSLSLVIPLLSKIDAARRRPVSPQRVVGQTPSRLQRALATALQSSAHRVATPQSELRRSAASVVAATLLEFEDDECHQL